MATLESRVNVPEDVLFHEVEGETVLMSVTLGKYFALDEVGTRMWLLMNEHGNLKAVHQALIEEYEAAPPRLEEDLLALVNDLAAQGLLQILEP